MRTYSSNKFLSLYESDPGRRIWDFPSGVDNVARIGSAFELAKPALEGIEGQFLAEFEKVTAGRVQQIIGHMPRQILEQLDWVFDQTDMSAPSVAFSKAGCYPRHDWVTLRAFRNTSDPSEVVITDHRQNQLPSGPRWAPYATFVSPLRAAMAFCVINIKQLRQQVHSQGHRPAQSDQLLRCA